MLARSAKVVGSGWEGRWPVREEAWGGRYFKRQAGHDTNAKPTSRFGVVRPRSVTLCTKAPKQPLGG